MSIRILVAVGQPLLRDAIVAVLEGEPDLRVVALGGDGRQVVADAKRVGADVAIVDIWLPNCDVVDVIAEIVETSPACRVLVLGDDEGEDALLACVDAGANGFVTREAALSELIETVRALHHGETKVPGRMLTALLASLVRRSHQREEASRVVATLTRREREVLLLLAGGADNDEIARTLVISPQTARTHVQNSLGKLRVHSRLEAASYVIRHGLLTDLTVPSAWTDAGATIAGGA